MDGSVKRCTYAMAWTQVWAPNGKQIDPLVRGWAGSLLQDKREPNGLLYRRNRYLDPATGRFTQPDPIGLAGGLNAYGYANGDPVSFSDPFGLSPSDTVDVGCRPLSSAGAAVGNHCAVRVGEGDEKQAGELLNADGKNKITLLDPNDPKYVWTTVQVPAGMTSRQFDANVIRSFNAIGKTRHGADYSTSGAVNSNHFVWSVITAAGGNVPRSAVPKWALTPGICGGTGRFGQGNQCSP